MKDESLSLILSILETEISDQIDYLIKSEDENISFKYLDDCFDALFDLYDYTAQNYSQEYKDYIAEQKKIQIEQLGYFKIRLLKVKKAE